MGVQGHDRNITPFLKDSNPLELGSTKLSKLGACRLAAECVSVPMFKEGSGVGVQEAGEPPYCICGAVSTVVVVPARHLALVLVAMHVRGDA